jgi:integrase
MKAVKVYSDKQLQQSTVTSGTTLQPSNPAQPAAASNSTEEPAEPSCLLSEAWERYHSEKGKSRATWDGKLPDTARLAITDMVELCGDVPVSDITREQCRDFRDLQAIKPRDKLKTYKGWGLEEILDRVEEIPDEDRRKGGRPQEIINHISTFFQWMVDEQILDKTVANNLKVKQIEGAITKPWTGEQLTTLFSQVNLAEKAGIASLQSNQQALPLVMTLLLYTGARLDEICYLKSEDFVEKDLNSDGDIPTIIIRRLTVKGLKTPAATRKIPLHPDLVTIGVTDFFKQRRASGKPYLLDIPTKGDGKGNSVTQRFGAYRDNLGWEAGTGQSIRSFRKTLNTALVGRTDSEDRHRLMGHSLGTVNDSNYTERLALTLDRTYEALCSVGFGLDLSQLRSTLERFVPGYPKR